MDTDDHPSDKPPFTPAQNFLEACENKFASLEIDALARDLGLPAAQIAEVYSQLYAELKAQARVTDFLRVLVSRKVRARCQGRRLS